MPEYDINYYITVTKRVTADNAEAANDEAWDDVPYPDEGDSQCTQIIVFDAGTNTIASDDEDDNNDEDEEDESVGC